MMIPNGFTCMTEQEKQVLGQIKKHPTAVLGLPNVPSEEFLLTAVFLCPSIIRYVHNQSFWLRMLAVMLDKNTVSYVNGMTPEIQQVANAKQKPNITDLNPPHYILEIYANACNFQKYGAATLKLVR